MIGFALAAAVSTAKLPSEYWVCSYLGYATKLDQPVSVKYHVDGNRFYESLGAIDDFAEYKLILNSKDALFAVLPPLGEPGQHPQPYVSTVFIDKRRLSLIVTFQSMSDHSVKYRIGECASPVRP